MEKSNTWMCHMMAACLGIAFAGSTANANTISLGDLSHSAVTGGSEWRYTYSFANSFLQPGDFFTINDFGPATVAVAPNHPGSTWVFSQSLLGVNSVPDSVLPFGDNPAVLNATFTWAGAPTSVGTVGGLLFALRSPFSADATDVSYSTLDHASSNPQRTSAGFGSVLAPLGAQSGAASPVPDGGPTVALLGVALFGMEGLRRRLSTSRFSR